MIDLRQDAPDQTDVIDPKKLSEEVEKLKTIQTTIKSLEDRIKDLKEDEKHYSFIVIPKLMEDMNLKSLKLKDGSELKITNKFFASAKADKKQEAIKWLRDNGLGDIVKNEIIVNFGQNEDTKAMAYATLARERGFEPSQKETVHHASLSVVMREWKEKGNEIPADLFSVLDADQAKIKSKS